MFYYNYNMQLTASVKPINKLNINKCILTIISKVTTVKK